MTAIRIDHWVKLGTTAKEARIARGWTQHELARRAKVSRSWLARVEAGHRGAELEPLFRLLSALKITIRLEVADGYAELAAQQDVSLRKKVARRHASANRQGESANDDHSEARQSTTADRQGLLNADSIAALRETRTQELAAFESVDELIADLNAPD